MISIMFVFKLCCLWFIKIRTFTSHGSLLCFLIKYFWNLCYSLSSLLSSIKTPVVTPRCCVTNESSCLHILSTVGQEDCVVKLCINPNLRIVGHAPTHSEPLLFHTPPVGGSTLSSASGYSLIRTSKHAAEFFDEKTKGKRVRQRGRWV